MKKVVLVIPPQEKFNKDYLPSIGVGYLASSLERAGYEVKIIDSHAEHLNDEETVNRIIEEKPEVVGVTASSHNRFHAISVCRGVKEKSNGDIFVTVGGCHFSPTAVSTLESIPEIDTVVLQEGELTFIDLLNGYFQKKPLENVLGIAFRRNGKVLINSPRPFIKDLDDLPMPAWHLFDFKKYDARLEGEEKTKSIGVISSRGCPNECVFCVNSSFWQRLLRRRSPKKFIDEVEFLHRNYGYNGFDFWDDTITIFKDHIREICEEIIRRKLDIVWYARARVNTVDRDILSLMRKAGCKVISFGVESGSPKILERIKKRITIDQVRKTVKTCAELKYIVKLFFIYSLPGETLEDIKATRDLMRELKFYGPNIHVLPGFTFIYPGTAIESIAKEEGTLSRDFNWNIPVEFDINNRINVNPTIPLYQQKDLKVEEIKSFLDSGKTKSLELIKSIPLAVKGVKNSEDFQYLLERGISYLRRKFLKD
jgi:anaerobic magnesium-protoporphyrin IX monomethyl ester cyclase